MRRNKKPQNLSKELERYSQKGNMKNDIESLRLQRAWEKIAPEESLLHSDNIVYKNNTKASSVLVFVDSSQWAAELSLQSEILRILLNNELGKQIEEIKFLVSRKTAEKIDFKRKRKEQPPYIEDIKSIPLTEQEKQKIWKDVKKISNEKLRNKLFQTIIKDMEWKKAKELGNKP